MLVQQLISKIKLINPWQEAVATVIYCGTEKTELWRTVIRYQYEYQGKHYEAVKLFDKSQNIHSQMDARLLADRLVRQYPIGSQHLVKVQKNKAWNSKLF